MLGWGSADGRFYWGLHLRYYYYFAVEGHLQQEHDEVFAGEASDDGRAASDRLGSCTRRRRPRCEQDCGNGNDLEGRHVYRRSEAPRRPGSVGSQHTGLRETFLLESRVCQPKRRVEVV